MPEHSPRPTDSSRERIKRGAAGLALSLVMHAFGGHEGQEYAERTRIEKELEKHTADRDAVKDIMFLPVTKAELTQDLLRQAGVTSIEELQKHPEKIKRIDLGKYFLQTEFLERKVSAKNAVQAMQILELKRSVFKELAEQMPDRRFVIQEIMNEIVDAQIYPEDYYPDTQGQDYTSGMALLSSALLHGESNCYGSTREFLAIAEPVYPDMRIQLNEPVEHLRPMVTIDDKIYIAEFGLLLQDAAKVDLGGTVVHQDAHASFFSDLGISSKKILVPEHSTIRAADLPDTATAGGVYTNTSGANYRNEQDAIKPTRRLPNGSVPTEADRKRVDYFSPDMAENAYLMDERIDSNIQSIAEEKKRILKEKKHAEERIRQSPFSLPPSLDSVQNLDNGTKDGSKEKKSYIPKKLDSYQQHTLIEAEMRVTAYALDSIHHPEKKQENDKKIALWMQTLEKAGLLEMYAERHHTSLARLEQFKDMPVETLPAIARAEFETGQHIDTFKARHLQEMALVQEEMEYGLMSHLLYAGELKFSDTVPASTKKQHPDLLLETYTIPHDQIASFVKEKVIPALDDTKRYTLKRLNLTGINSSYIAEILSLLENYLPKERVIISGAVEHTDAIAKYLSIDLERGPVLEWINPEEGQDVAPLAELIAKGKIYLLDITKESIEQGFSELKPISSDFSMVDETTEKIKNINTPLERMRKGKKFSSELLTRYAIRGVHNNLKLDLPEKFAGHYPAPLSNDDMIIIGKRIAQFGVNSLSILDISNVSGLAWLNEWSKLGLIKKPSGLTLSWISFKDIPINFSGIESALEQTDKLIVNGGTIIDWGALKNKRIDISSSTDFLKAPDVDFFLDKKEVKFGLKKDQFISLAPTIKKTNAKTLEIKIFGPQQRFELHFPEINTTFDVLFNKEEGIVPALKEILLPLGHPNKDTWIIRDGKKDIMSFGK